MIHHVPSISVHLYDLYAICTDPMEASIAALAIHEMSNSSIHCHVIGILCR